MGPNFLIKTFTIITLIFLSVVISAQTDINAVRQNLNELGIEIESYNYADGLLETKWKNIDVFDLRILADVREKYTEKIGNGKIRLKFSRTDSLPEIEVYGFEKNFKHFDTPWISFEPRNSSVNFYRGIQAEYESNRRYFNAEFNTVWRALTFVFRDFEITVNYIDKNNGTLRSNFKTISNLAFKIITRDNNVAGSEKIKIVADIRRINNNRMQVIINATFEEISTSNLFLENIMLDYIDLYLRNDPEKLTEILFEDIGYNKTIRNISDGDLFYSLNNISNIDHWIDNLIYRETSEPEFKSEEYLEKVNSNRNLRRIDVTAGDKICRNLIPVAQNYEIQFGSRIDFGYDFQPFSVYGLTDLKFVNRLLKAYLITKNNKYIRYFIRIFQQWYEQKNTIISGNPAQTDAVYNEEAVYQRIMNLTDIYYHTAYKYLLPKTTHLNILKELLSCGRWLYNEHITKGFRPGITRIKGVWGLINLAVQFPEYKDSKKWLDTGMAIINKHLSKKEILDDGGMFNRSVSGTFEAAEIYVRIYLCLIKDKPEMINKNFKNQLNKIITWLTAMKTPVNTLPAFNYSFYPDVEWILNKASEIYHKEEYRNITIGIDSLIENIKLPDYTSINLEDSKFAVMRSDWTKNALYMAVNYGQSDWEYSSNGAVDFVIFACGIPMAVTPGRPELFNPDEINEQYLSSMSQNMLLIDYMETEKADKDLKIKNLNNFKNTDFFSAANNTFLHKNGISLIRDIIFKKPYKNHCGYWIIKDKINSGDGLYHKYSWIYNSPGKLLKHTSNMVFNSDAPGMVLRYFPKNVSAKIHNVEGLNPSSNLTIDMNRLELSQLTDKESPFFDVILIPFNNKKILPDITRKGNTLELQFDTHTDYFSGKTDNNNESLLKGKYYSAFLSIDGDISYISVIDCENVTFEGNRLIESIEPVSLEIEFIQDKLYIYGENPEGIKLYAPNIKEVIYNNTVFPITTTEENYIGIVKETGEEEK